MFWIGFAVGAVTGITICVVAVWFLGRLSGT
jgi:hypothetical protein